MTTHKCTESRLVHADMPTYIIEGDGSRIVACAINPHFFQPLFYPVQCDVFASETAFGCVGNIDKQFQHTGQSVGGMAPTHGM